MTPPTSRSTKSSPPPPAPAAVTSGKITQVIGPVIDVEFPPGALPEIFTALTVSNPSISDKADNLTVEVAQHLGENTARCIAMDSTEGLVRGQAVKNTGSPITMPVGKGVLGRILNVVGEPVDEKGPIVASKRLPIHRDPPEFTEQDVRQLPFETGIKVIDLLAPYLRGGKIGLFGGAGVGKTVLLHGADQQRRQGARRLLGVRRRRRADPRGQRPLHRVPGRRKERGHQDRQARGVPGGAGLRADERAARRPRPRRACPR